jgi:hypothetical protein
VPGLVMMPWFAVTYSNEMWRILSRKETQSGVSLTDDQPLCGLLVINKTVVLSGKGRGQCLESHC